ncbi:MAG: hypothetical protein WB611_30675 [Stellaceae bacterium]
MSDREAHPTLAKNQFPSTGKYAGNGHQSIEIPIADQMLASQFPWQAKREFLQAQSGIFSAEPGIAAAPREIQIIRTHTRPKRL